MFPFMFPIFLVFVIMSVSSPVNQFIFKVLFIGFILNVGIRILWIGSIFFCNFPLFLFFFIFVYFNLVLVSYCDRWLLRIYRAYDFVVLFFFFLSFIFIYAFSCCFWFFLFFSFLFFLLFISSYFSFTFFFVFFLLFFLYLSFFMILLVYSLLLLFFC